MPSGCGSCTLCCKLMGVPELSKPTCQWCSLAVPGTGCSAYDGRPKSCRDFECVWLQSQSRPEPLPDELRPDRCGVIMVAQDGPRIPIALHVDPHKPNAHRRPVIDRFIGRIVRDGKAVAVIVGPKRSLVCPPGFKP